MRHGARNDDVKSMLTIENRGTGQTNTLANIVCTFCTSRYDDVCVGLVGEVLFYPSLCVPYPFFRTSMTSLLPLPQSPGHTSTHGDLSPSFTLSFSVSRVLSRLSSFSLSFLSLALLPSLSQKESRIWQGSIHPCPYSHDPAISTAPARFSRAHMDSRIRTQRLRESKRDREKEEGCMGKSEKENAGEGARDVPTMKKKNREAC